MGDTWSESVLEPMDRLIAAWCERRELKALAIVLPAWVNNFGLTDGWTAVVDALADLRRCTWLPEDERAVAEQVAGRVQDALGNRG